LEFFKQHLIFCESFFKGQYAEHSMALMVVRWLKGLRQIDRWTDN